MKVAIYCRVSRIDLNPENQKIQLIEHAKQKGWEYEVFEETPVAIWTTYYQFRRCFLLINPQPDIISTRCASSMFVYKYRDLIIITIFFLELKLFNAL